MYRSSVETSDAQQVLSRIRVASIPRGHVYVRHIDPETPLRGVPEVARPDDPDPDDPDRFAQSRWWPPVMLEADWVLRHPEFDVMHLQFGFDARSPAQLHDWVNALHETGRPLVYTVHDLRNPHHVDRRAHDEQLDVLIPRADALLTLTEGAAREIRRRWNRVAVVVPHPHVVELDTMAAFAARARHRSGFRVGVHVKSLRAGMEPLPVIRVLIDAVRRIEGGVLQVDGHRDVLDTSGERYDRELATFLRAAAERGDVDLRVHDFFGDDELWEYLWSLDLSVLPYRFGTHSGWLEACRDLGTAVAVPSVGYYREQGPAFEYRHDGAALDEQSLRDAIRAAHAGPRPPAASVAARRAQRREIALAHARLYEELRP